MAQNRQFRPFLGIFSESTIEILVLNRQNIEENSTEQTQKTAALNLFKKSRYPCARGYTILHFSGGHILKMSVVVVVVVVVNQKDLENGSNDFLETLHDVRHW